MVDSSNILTATLAELRTYFEGWHKDNYESLHTGVSNSIDSLQNQINEIKNTIIDSRISNALKNYYNKDDSDTRYLLDNKTGNKNNNTTFSNEYLLIQNNKKNKEAIASETSNGLITPSMYKSIMQLCSPGLASGALALNTPSSNGQWQKVSPVFDSKENNFDIYKKYFGGFTQMIRFGAMRTLNMSYIDGDYGKYYKYAFVGFASHEETYPKPVRFQDTNGTWYYPICRMATEDEPMDMSGTWTINNNMSIRFLYLDSTNYPDLYLSGGDGVYLVIFGNVTIDDGSVKAVGSATWIAKNIKNNEELIQYNNQ